MNSTELTEWAAFMELEGLPEPNAEIRAARALQHFVNAYRDHERSSHDYELKDFLPGWILDDVEPPAEEEDDPPGVDPVVAKRASEKMASLSGMFR